MVNVSTLVYVLENIKGIEEELTNLEELLEEEEAYVKRIFDKLDDSDFQLSPGLVEHILKTASTI